MALDDFIENLRFAAGWLPPAKDPKGHRSRIGSRLLFATTRFDDLWITPQSVADFNADDFGEWSKAEREKLTKEIAEFKTIAEQVSAAKPAKKLQQKQARKHLERVIEIVRPKLLNKWLGAQEEMLNEAKEAARTKGWYADQDEKKMSESILGEYEAPRLRIRTIDTEVLFNPIAYFGSGDQGIVDLVVMPTYETRYLVTFKEGRWNIVNPGRSLNSRPFTRATFVNTINRLSRH